MKHRDANVRVELSLRTATVGWYDRGLSGWQPDSSRRDQNDVSSEWGLHNDD
ncbi:MAG: hypothetical protein HKN13_11610 [Rhodothermales bacterium]|nr:hypothetical protein [Rhodothermales bacterium]